MVPYRTESDDLLVRAPYTLAPSSCSPLLLLAPAVALQTSTNTNRNRMFDLEDVWTTTLKLDQNITVPGLSPIYPNVTCNDAGSICHITTGEAEINAACSVSVSKHLSQLYTVGSDDHYLTIH